jgi:hypothetical protein
MSAIVVNRDEPEKGMITKQSRTRVPEVAATAGTRNHRPSEMPIPQAPTISHGIANLLVKEQRYQNRTPHKLGERFIHNNSRAKFSKFSRKLNAKWGGNSDLKI